MKNDKTSMGAVKVFIVDDHEVVRLGLSQFINSHDNIDVCGEAADANSAISLISAKSPDVVIVDINLEGISGIDLMKAIKSRFKNVLILALSMHGESEVVERALKAGARGYVLKSEPVDQVIDAILHIKHGGTYLSGPLKDILLNGFFSSIDDRGPVSLQSLTDREFEIFKLIGEGLNRREISKRLNLTTSTIGTYRDRIKNKLNIRSSSELVKYAVGWCLQNKQ